MIIMIVLYKISPAKSGLKKGNAPPFRLGLMRPQLVHLHPLVHRLLKAPLLLQLFLPNRDMLLLLKSVQLLLLLLLPYMLLLLLLLLQSPSVPHSSESESRYLEHCEKM